MTTDTDPQPFKAEIAELLGILVHSLYQDREVFLRELISNASDALSRVKLELLRSDADIQDPETELAIWLCADPDANTLTVRDSGIGMSADELRDFLGTIAHSGARTLLEGLKAQGGATPQELIGNFGVGFYAAFMVADEVRVTSKGAATGAVAASWRSDGQRGFEVGPAERGERGTSVELKLKPDAAEFARPERLRAIVQQHSDFVGFPIYLETAQGQEKLNRQSALWRAQPQQVTPEQKEAFYRQLTRDEAPPARALHLVTDSPIQLYALLFFPSGRPLHLEDYGLALYARKVLIAPRFKELLPPYLRFVTGVVDAEDLPLNVSRETVQATPLIARLRKVLSKRVLSELTGFAQDDPEGFERFFREFGVFLKEGVATDPTAAEALTPLLRFPSTRAEGEALVSLGVYVGRMPEGQKDIYYALGEDLALLRRSGQLEPFLARGLEVLLFTDPADPFLLMGLTEYGGKALRSVDDASLTLPEASGPARLVTPPDEAVISLAAFAKRALGERVADVRLSAVLTQSDARLISPEGSHPGLYRAQRLLGQETELPRRVLELNPQSALVRGLAQRLDRDSDDELLPLMLEQLFENELLAEGLHPNPAQMLPRLQTLLAALVEGDPDDPRADASA